MAVLTTSCGITHQEIAAKMQCRVVPVLQEITFEPVRMLWEGQTLEMYGPRASPACASAFWRPVGMMQPAVYAGDGQFTLTLAPAQRQGLIVFLREVAERCPVILPEARQQQDGVFNFPDFVRASARAAWPYVGNTAPYTLPVEGTQELAELDKALQVCWGYVLGTAARSRLFMNRGGRDTMRSLQFAVLHEETYRELVQRQALVRRQDGESNALQRTLQRALNCARGGPQEKGGGSLADRYTSKLETVLSRFGASISYFNGAEYELLMDAGEQLEEGTLVDAEFFEQMRPFLEDRYALHYLESINCKLTPMTFGGQGTLHGTGIAYADFVSAVRKKMARG